jgi:hypothetical protein
LRHLLPVKRKTTLDKPEAKADSFKGDKRKLDEVIKGMDKVRQQREKII